MLIIEIRIKTEFRIIYNRRIKIRNKQSTLKSRLKMNQSHYA